MPVSGGGTAQSGLGGAQGYGEQEVSRSDDGSLRLNLSAVFQNGFNYYGRQYAATDVWVNTNGTLTFGGAFRQFPTSSNASTNRDLIAPFWGDVDTRLDGEGAESGSIWVDVDAAADVVSITWENVGVYRRNADLTNTFQLQLYDRGGGNFDIVFRYESIDWTIGTGEGDTGARAGLFGTAGTQPTVLQEGRGHEALGELDALGGNTGTIGLWVFEMRNGVMTEAEPQGRVQNGSGQSNSIQGDGGSDILNGGGGNDTLAGAAGADTLDGGTGDDALYGGAGADNLSGGAGNDILNGGAGEADGADTMQGGAGNDRLDGGPGDDRLFGGAGNDLLRGEDGNDRLEGGDGADTLDGGAGDDFIFGGASTADLRDVVYGGDGNDNIDGGHGNDALNGGAGNDTIAGGFGADTVIGNGGDDVLTGAAFGDVIFGSDGDDFINGGFGYDRVNGGIGADRFFHIGVADHGSDWIQDYNWAEGDVLAFGVAATRAQFQINVANTPNAGSSGTAEAFIIYRPTGQIIWALVDGDGQREINVAAGGTTFDLTG